jgi:hypothetical protein
MKERKRLSVKDYIRDICPPLLWRAMKRVAYYNRKKQVKTESASQTEEPRTLTPAEDSYSIDLYAAMTPLKKEVIDYAFRQHKNIKSVVELGCVWGVNGVYGRYIAQHYPETDVTMVDTNWNSESIKLCSEHSNIKTLAANFGSDKMPSKIGNVDAIILFDVLLHQVAPDWDRILQIYAPYTYFFIIVNPQFVDSPITIRLLDLGYDGYFDKTPHEREHPTYKKLFENMYEINPEHGRIWRDVHNVWQFGITDKDLIETMYNLGFEPVFIKNEGQGSAHYPTCWENTAFVFKKKQNVTEH